ncbi:MAG: SigE family RNA polymerase sigma factor [Actinobacteria bacterium]|nr:SigE family RNA polymerase sigma factor [Actinomycetota bacterium]
MSGIARTAASDDRIDRAAERSRELSVVFYEEYPRLWAMAFAMLGDVHLAEETVMEAFSKAFSAWGRIREFDRRSAYLRKIVLNLCRGKLRRRGLEQKVNALMHRRSEREASGDWVSKHSDARLDVWDALGRLPERQRACVVLRYFDDMTDAQVAEILDCSVGTVKSHLFRARKTLADLLDEPPGSRHP